MVKRKANQASDDSEIPAQSAAVAPSKSLKRGVKKPKFVMVLEDEDEEEEEEEPKPKKNVKSKPPTSSNNGSLIKESPEGDKYIDLGKKKRATVRSFKGSTFVDIREFYGDTEQSMKPGKKGVSLALDQWEVLRSSASAIDELFAAEQKKK
ncbi:transcriptional Coactivator p15-domain-containing protein [Lentinula edodes]|nr:transcriptional Coactivator p15-domain-containing protein [Lentinula edodes]